MSDDAEDYESINLASMIVEAPPLTLLSTVPESSDDGLDPHEFLTHNQTEGVSNDTVNPEDNNTDTSVNDKFDRSNSMLASHLYESTLKGSISSAALPADDLLFLDTESGWQSRQQRELLLRFLLNRHDSLKEEMHRDMKIHHDFIAQGSDCKQVREIIGDRFLQMSENSFALNEIYEQENTLLRSFLNHLESWDLKRARVLNRVKSIKSDKHSFGHKLAGLLQKRNDIDSEIKDLEDRLAVLRDNRAVVNAEIDEASSVLESKSAKYVNLFRELEKHGENVISGFLVSSGLPQNDLQVLLKRKNVETAFKYELKNNLPPASKQTRSPAYTPKNQSVSPNKSVTIEPQSMGAHSFEPQSMGAQAFEPQSMGAQAFEVNDDELPDYSEKTAYEKGFQRGNEQLHKVKETLASYVNSFINGKSEVKQVQKAIDDELNTITSKIDLDPIITFLSHRIKALEDLAVESSRRSAELHQDGESWRAVTQILNSREARLLEVVSQSTEMTSEVKELLSSNFHTLRQAINDINKSDRKVARSKYLKILLHREAKAIASTLDTIDKDFNYSSKISSIESSFTDDLSDTEPLLKPISNLKLTHYGYRPTPISIVNTTTENVDGKSSRGGESVYEKSSKDIKHE